MACASTATHPASTSARVPGEQRQEFARASPRRRRRRGRLLGAAGARARSPRRRSAGALPLGRRRAAGSSPATSRPGRARRGCSSKRLVTGSSRPARSSKRSPRSRPTTATSAPGPSAASGTSGANAELGVHLDRVRHSAGQRQWAPKSSPAAAKTTTRALRRGRTRCRSNPRCAPRSPRSDMSCVWVHRRPTRLGPLPGLADQRVHPRSHVSRRRRVLWIEIDVAADRGSRAESGTRPAHEGSPSSMLVAAIDTSLGAEPITPNLLPSTAVSNAFADSKRAPEEARSPDSGGLPRHSWRLGVPGLARLPPAARDQREAEAHDEEDDAEGRGSADHPRRPRRSRQRSLAAWRPGCGRRPRSTTPP